MSSSLRVEIPFSSSSFCAASTSSTLNTTYAPKVNQENRIKLMLAVGKENLNKQLEEEKNKAENKEDNK